jgi:predicted alpha/beta-hydrolase family hydrolase
VLLAHGAGADMHAATLTTSPTRWPTRRVPSLRFNFPYKAGRPARARPRARARGAVRDRGRGELARRAKLPPERLVLGGRSMGGHRIDGRGRDADDGALGLVLLGYPLHPPGKGRASCASSTSPRLRMPALFVSGTRDAFGTPAELKRETKKVKGAVSFHWIETGDHGFKPLKSSGLTVGRCSPTSRTRSSNSLPGERLPDRK